MSIRFYTPIIFVKLRNLVCQCADWMARSARTVFAESHEPVASGRSKFNDSAGSYDGTISRDSATPRSGEISQVHDLSQPVLQFHNCTGPTQFEFTRHFLLPGLQLDRGCSCNYGLLWTISGNRKSKRNLSPLSSVLEDCK